MPVQKNNNARPPKKSESIEIRLSFEAKQAFAARCNAEQRTASEVLRSYIEERTRTPVTAPVTAPLAAGRGLWRTVIAGMAGLALGLGVAAPSLAAGLEKPAHDCGSSQAPLP